MISKITWQNTYYNYLSYHNSHTLYYNVYVLFKKVKDYVKGNEA